jgi:hypothetical protein
MAHYFGNGHLLNLVRRGAVPFAKLRRAPAHVPPPLRDLIPSDEGPIEIHSESKSKSSAPTTSPVKSPARSTEIETVSRKVSTTTADSPHLPRGTPVAKEASVLDRPATRARKASPPPERLPTLPRPEPTQQKQEGGSLPQRSPAVIPDPPRPQNEKSPRKGETFELKMPEGFFGKSRPSLNPVHMEKEVRQTEINLSSIIAPRNAAEVVNPPETKPAVETQAEPPPELKTTKGETAKVGADSRPIQVVQQVSLPPEITAQISGGATALTMEKREREVVRVISPVDPYEAPAPMPEPRIPEYLQPMRPQVNAPAADPSPARLRINRMDIQVINTVAPPAPRAAAPDMSRLLEKKHLGRVGLLW